MLSEENGELQIFQKKCKCDELKERIKELEQKLKNIKTGSTCACGEDCNCDELKEQNKYIKQKTDKLQNENMSLKEKTDKLENQV